MVTELQSWFSTLLCAIASSTNLSIILHQFANSANVLDILTVIICRQGSVMFVEEIYLARCLLLLFMHIISFFVRM
jgi:hypothetical protein